MDELINEKCFWFQFPIFGYVIGSGPHLGFLGCQDSSHRFVPVWTDKDLFERYVEKAGLQGKVSGLVINSKEEFINFLQAVPDGVRELAIDPEPVKEPRIIAYKVVDLLRQFTQ